jgi:hypothetical protein
MVAPLLRIGGGPVTNLDEPVFLDVVRTVVDEADPR